MGGTEHQHRLVARHLRVIGIKIERILAAFYRHFAFDHLPPCGGDHTRKGVVNRCEQDNSVPGLGEGVDTHRGSVNQAVRGENPLGRDFPAVSILHPPLDGTQIFAVIAEVAIDTMVQHILQRGLNHLRRAEIHIRNPHGNARIRGDAVDRLHLVPFRAMGATPVDDFVKAHGVLLSDLADTLNLIDQTASPEVAAAQVLA